MRRVTRSDSVIVAVSLTVQSLFWFMASMSDVVVVVVAVVVVVVVVVVVDGGVSAVGWCVVCDVSLCSMF